MLNHSRSSSSSSSGEDDNKIEYIGGTHHSGERFLELKWEVYYFASHGINRDTLKNLLEERFGHRGYALSLLGISTYQLWTPVKLTQADFEHCKNTSSENSEANTDKSSNKASDESSDKSSDKMSSKVSTNTSDESSEK